MLSEKRVQLSNETRNAIYMYIYTYIIGSSMSWEYGGNFAGSGKQFHSSASRPLGKSSTKPSVLPSRPSLVTRLPSRHVPSFSGHIFDRNIAFCQNNAYRSKFHTNLHKFAFNLFYVKRAMYKNRIIVLLFEPALKFKAVREAFFIDELSLVLRRTF